MTTKKRWTKKEHSILENTIKEALLQGEKISKAYKMAAFKTGRTVEACRWRWNNVVQTCNTQNTQSIQKSNKNSKIAQFKPKKPKNITVKKPLEIQSLDNFDGIEGLTKLLEGIFGGELADLFGNNTQQKNQTTNVKDYDVSNLTVYPMYGSAADYTVIDEKTKKSYLVCVLSKEYAFCSCQHNPITNSSCRHVRKVKIDKKY